MAEAKAASEASRALSQYDSVSSPGQSRGTKFMLK